MLTTFLLAIGFLVAGAVLAVVTARIATRPTRRGPTKNNYDISDVALVECPDCGISTFAGTTHCPVCGRSL